MRKIYQITILTALSGVIYACGNAEAGNNKLAELEALKEQKIELEARIADLEQELLKSGELKMDDDGKVLVTIWKMDPVAFEHKVEIRGAVASRNNVMLTAETMGKIKAVLVKEGQKVKKGQLLVQLDADVVKNNIVEVKTQYELAEKVYGRQARLWEQKIGTEIQFLQAKSNMESLEARLATLRSQQAMSSVTAPFDGVVDDIPVNAGEVIQPGYPVVRIINQNDSYISADVSESFLGKFKSGQQVEVYFPIQDKRLVTRVKSVGQMIKSENRTFEIEVDLPRADFAVQPNQVVVLRLVDYSRNNALVVPTKLVQKDNKGNFVFEVFDQNGRLVAKKVPIEIGMSYEEKTEVKSGLKVGQILALEGYRDLSENVFVTIDK